MTLRDELRLAVRYVVRDGRPVVEQEDRDLLMQSGVVYARFADDDPHPVYIGKADGTLSTRMREHFRRAADPANAPYWQWAEGRTISIHAIRPDPTVVLGRTIPVHRALEAALIAEFRPVPSGSRSWFVKKA